VLSAQEKIAIEVGVSPQGRNSFFWAWEFGSYSPSAEEAILRVSLLSTNYVPLR
jgi:hypothetical protein